MTTGVPAPDGGGAGRADLLEAALGGATGASCSVVVAGAPGCGRSTLLTTLIARLRAREPGTRILAAVGVAWESGERHALLGHLLPSLRGRTWTSPLAAADAVVAALPDVDGAPLRRTAIIIDDAHLADADSLQVLTSVVRHHPEAQVVLVLAARTTAAGHPLLPGGVVGRVVDVAPLTPQEVSALAARRGVPLAPSVAEQLTEHTAGTARHVVSLLAQTPRAAWTDPVPVLGAPPDVVEDTTARLAACGPDAQTLVASVAVLRGRAPVWLAAVVAENPDPLPAVDDAERHGLLKLHDQPDEVVLELANPMVRAAVLDTIGPLHRSELHQRAAVHVQDPAQSLSHAVAARPVPDAHLADRLEALASERGSTGRWASAAELFLLASRTSGDCRLRARRLVRAVDALVGAGDVPAAAGHLAEVESLVESPLRNAVLGYLAIVRGRPREAEAQLSRAWQLVSTTRDPEVAAMICHRRVLHHLARCEGSQLVAWADRAVELVGATGPAAVEAQAIRGLGLGSTGRTAEGLRSYRLLLAHAHGGSVGQRVQMGAGWLHLANDEIDLARTEFESAVPLDHLGGSTRISLWARAWLARTQFVTGEWDAALTTTAGALQLAQRSGTGLVVPLLRWTATQVHALRGEWASATDNLRSGEAGDGHYEIMRVPAALARASIAEARADYAGVLRALEPLTRPWAGGDVAEPGFWPWPDVYANALVLEGRLGEAEIFLGVHEARARQRGHGSAQARLGYARGRLLGARGDLAGARAQFEESLELLAPLPLVYDRARVNFCYGQTLRRAGKRLEADALIAAARDGYACLGATTYVERCQRELRAGGVHALLRGRAADALTPQEDTVAGLVATGMTNREVAAELFLSVKTVQFHLTRVYAKLGVRSRSELAASYAGPEDGRR